jgi:hypothetical protein
MNLAQKIRTGLTTAESFEDEFADAVEQWHAGDSSVDLHVFLGFSQKLYFRVAEQSIPFADLKKQLDDGGAL